MHGTHALLQPSGSTVVSNAVSWDVASSWRCWSLSLRFPSPKKPGLTTCPQLDNQSKKIMKKKWEKGFTYCGHVGKSLEGIMMQMFYLQLDIQLSLAF